MNGEKEMWTYCIYEKEAEAKGEELLRKYKMGNSVRNNPITQYRTPSRPICHYRSCQHWSGAMVDEPVWFYGGRCLLSSISHEAWSPGHASLVSITQLHQFCGQVCAWVKPLRTNEKTSSTNILALLSLTPGSLHPRVDKDNLQMGCSLNTIDVLCQLDTC